MKGALCVLELIPCGGDSVAIIIDAHEAAYADHTLVDEVGMYLPPKTLGARLENYLASAEGGPFGGLIGCQRRDSIQAARSRTLLNSLVSRSPPEAKLPDSSSSAIINEMCVRDCSS